MYDVYRLLVIKDKNIVGKFKLYCRGNLDDYYQKTSNDRYLFVSNKDQLLFEVNSKQFNVDSEFYYNEDDEDKINRYYSDLQKIDVYCKRFNQEQIDNQICEFIRYNDKWYLINVIGNDYGWIMNIDEVNSRLDQLNKDNIVEMVKQYV